MSCTGKRVSREKSTHVYLNISVDQGALSVCVLQVLHRSRNGCKVLHRGFTLIGQRAGEGGRGVEKQRVAGLTTREWVLP